MNRVDQLLADLASRGGSPTEAAGAGPPRPAPVATGPADGLVVRRLADVTAQDVDFLWSGRIPYGKITVIAGDPGVGKSYITMAITAAVTLGARLPDDDRDRPAADVLIASYEDDAEDTLRPRADLLGVDPSRVTIIEGANGDDGGVRPFCAADVDLLGVELDRLNNPRLLIVDPVAAWVGGGVDTYRDNEVRAALEGMRRLAAERGIAVILVMHLRKSAAANALARLSGSGAYGQLVRSALLAGRDPDDDSRCALAHIKHNLSAKQPTLGYRIDDLGLTWTGVVDDLDGERLAGHDPDDQRSALGEAEEFLASMLDAGPRSAGDVLTDAKRAGIAERR